MERLVQEARRLFGIRLSDWQVAALQTYERELLEWNRRFNLTAIRDVEGIRIKHFLDSFSCVLAWKDNPPRCLVDVGSGAGFPGIPLKILYPSMSLTIIESVGKKARFCAHIVEKLALEKVEVIAARAEEVGHWEAHRERYDWAVARAVATLPVLVEYLLPLTRLGGRVLAQKGEGARLEVHQALRALKILGGEVRQLIPVILPGVVEERCLVVVDKIAAVPPQYPRRTGVPARRPL
jgi:16S rRNA (guanine527-N7)-methyltransferase